MVKLLGWHAIVLHWVHLGIVYIKTTLCRLLQDGIALDDEGIVQIAAHYLPETWGLVGYDNPMDCSLHPSILSSGLAPCRNGWCGGYTYVPAMGIEGASYEATCHEPSVCLLFLQSDAMGCIPYAYHDGCHNQEEGYLLEIKQDAEIEYLSGTFTEYHIQHKSIDMEMVDAIYLRVEVIEDTEQDDTHNLYCHSRLMAATRQHDGAQ